MHVRIRLSGTNGFKHLGKITSRRCCWPPFGGGGVATDVGRGDCPSEVVPSRLPCSRRRGIPVGGPGLVAGSGRTRLQFHRSRCVGQHGCEPESQFLVCRYMRGQKVLTNSWRLIERREILQSRLSRLRAPPENLGDGLPAVMAPCHRPYLRKPKPYPGSLKVTKMESS